MYHDLGNNIAPGWARFELHGDPCNNDVLMCRMFVNELWGIV